ncbi:MAG: S-layer family protein, partial [Cyanobacteria bacterium J06639_18]
GKGGNINLAAGFLNLNNGTISAQTRSNTGGNINLNLQNLLLLRNGSQISTTAGNQQFGGDGGNITINTPFIVALPQENSDITANAFSGNGGKIDITTNAIFGIFPRDTSTLFSDITASSQLGVNGEISIDAPDLDPSSGLVELPSNLVDTSQQIAQGCSTTRSRKKVNSFTRIGRGGLPLSPNESLRGRAVITNWVDLPSQIANKRPNQRENQLSRVTVNGSQSSDRNQIVEAQDLVVDAKGDIFLVAKSTQSNITPSGFACSK